MLAVISRPILRVAKSTIRDVVKSYVTKHLKGEGARASCHGIIKAAKAAKAAAVALGAKVGARAVALGAQGEVDNLLKILMR
jgi:hypothetical protein